jgi:hypothetical protein
MKQRNILCAIFAMTKQMSIWAGARTNIQNFATCRQPLCLLYHPAIPVDQIESKKTVM